MKAWIRWSLEMTLRDFFQVGAQLPLEEKEELVELLRRNVDVFAWDAYEADRKSVV